ncbi:hypothetical protein AC1031_016868 [Aphanomyces cochlioides]|nr:hypothetical protein AC1031_016868 [Aphanomyces cochlioides]
MVATTSKWIERWHKLNGAVNHVVAYTSAIEVSALQVWAASASTLGYVIVQASSKSLVDKISVTVEMGVLSIGWIAHVGAFVGKYIVQVFLPPQSLQAVAFAAPRGNMVVHPRVFHRSLMLPLSIHCTSQRGTLFIQDEVLVAQRLDLQLAASGCLQVAANVISVVETFDIQHLHGDGVLAVLASAVYAGNVEICQSCSGKTFMMAEETFQVREELSVLNHGPGSVTVVAADIFDLSNQYLQDFKAFMGSIHVVGTWSPTHSDDLAHTIQEQQLKIGPSAGHVYVHDKNAASANGLQSQRSWPEYSVMPVPSTMTPGVKCVVGVLAKSPPFKS